MVGVREHGREVGLYEYNFLVKRLKDCIVGVTLEVLLGVHILGEDAGIFFYAS